MFLSLTLSVACRQQEGERERDGEIERERGSAAHRSKASQAEREQRLELCEQFYTWLAAQKTQKTKKKKRKTQKKWKLPKKKKNKKKCEQRWKYSQKIFLYPCTVCRIAWHTNVRHPTAIMLLGMTFSKLLSIYEAGEEGRIWATYGAFFT